ncbi:hypothetical protein OF83DRAFT_597379 [Amylostereum chailletii]|nr:hypothetical protein OF83DRAFT_597379 [Amylostereum chailletii]
MGSTARGAFLSSWRRKRDRTKQGSRLAAEKDKYGWVFVSLPLSPGRGSLRESTSGQCNAPHGGHRGRVAPPSETDGTRARPTANLSSWIPGARSSLFFAYLSHTYLDRRGPNGELRGRGVGLGASRRDRAAKHASRRTRTLCARCVVGLRGVERTKQARKRGPARGRDLPELGGRTGRTRRWVSEGGEAAWAIGGRERGIDMRSPPSMSMEDASRDGREGEIERERARDEGACRRGARRYEAVGPGKGLRGGSRDAKETSLRGRGEASGVYARGRHVQRASWSDTVRISTVGMYELDARSRSPRIARGGSLGGANWPVWNVFAGRCGPIGVCVVARAGK